MLTLALSSIGAVRRESFERLGAPLKVWPRGAREGVIKTRSGVHPIE
jgi:hypothetical protein